MSVIPSVEALTSDYIKDLLDSKTQESRWLDYKRQIHANSDEAKKEFLADVSSFANSSGGLIIFGIAEDSSNGKNTGIPGEVVGIEKKYCDEAIQRIESQIRHGIEPALKVSCIAINGIIDDKPELAVIAVRIPQSLAAPHMVVFLNSSRFFARTSNGKCQLDVFEIRRAVIESESLSDKIRNFHLDRIAKICAGETIIKDYSVPIFLLHLIPLGSFSHSFSTPMIEFNNTLIEQIRGMVTESDFRHNIDGICSYRDFYDTPQHFHYHQIYKNGVIEVAHELAKRVPENNRPPFYGISCVSFERRINTKLGECFNIVRHLEVEFPILMMVSLLNVKGVEMYNASSYPYICDISGNPIDRNVIRTQEVYIEKYPTDQEVIVLRRNLADQVWQACGHERSRNWNEQGAWEPLS